VGDVSPFALVKDVSGLVVCFFTVFELLVWITCNFVFLSVPREKDNQRTTLVESWSNE
jgi:hypothetical protein